MSNTNIPLSQQHDNVIVEQFRNVIPCANSAIIFLRKVAKILIVIANQFGNGLIVIISLPHLYPPPPFGRGRIKVGEGLFLFRYRIDWIVQIK